MRMRVSISSSSPHCSHTSSRRSPVILQTARHSASAHGAQSTGQKLMVAQDVAIAVKTLMIGRIPVDGYRTAHKSVVSLPEGRCRREADMPRSRRMLTLFFAAVGYPIVKRHATFAVSK